MLKKFYRSRNFHRSRIFHWSGIFHPSAGIFVPKYCHVVQIKMASSDGSSARDILMHIVGRIGDLSASINQQGSSSSRGIDQTTTTTVEDEVRFVFNGIGQQACPSAAMQCRVVHFLCPLQLLALPSLQ